MASNEADNDTRRSTREVLGYVNFSSGASDPGFLKNLNDLFGQVEVQPAWESLGRVLREALRELRGQSDAFRQVDQAEAVLELVFDHALPAYRRHHCDLLFHQTDEQLFQPLFIGRVFEVVLQQGGPWDQTERIVEGAIGRLNDYLGHRPVAVLETEQKIQPYAHEYVRPIPLYVRGAGVGAGRHQELIRRALEILRTTDPALLFQAWFDPELLDELAVDPRAYDFDHPVNKRPNYLFGQWDLGKLDNSGRCRRFILQQVALDQMSARLEQHGELPYEELLFEAAAVLAGTMLMGSGVSGNCPDAHPSTTTLATLVQHIAAYRDAFYEKLIAGLSGKHARRLRAEAEALQQPFGGARQDFNQRLARRRAEQLQHVHLAQLFARLGYTEAARRQVAVVPVASARMKCDIYCRLTTANFELEKGRLEAAAAVIPEIEDILHRAIECGASIDPWNILGFGANYSLFAALENSIHDHRADELIELVGAIFELYLQIRKKAAAAANEPLLATLAKGLDNLARWWDRFATLDVGAVEGISGVDTGESADRVAAVLRAWHQAGTAAGDIAFWRGHVEQFRSAKAYALVIEALLQQRDLVAAMALLVQWLSRCAEIPLAEENYSFHDLALRWMEDLWSSEPDRRHDGQTRWDLARKFLDYIEANAEEMWEVPRFELAANAAEGSQALEQDEEEEDDDDEDDDDEDNLFSAAYERVTYRDSTDDGFDGQIFETGEDATDFELVLEAERILGRLAFLTTLAKLWKLAAVASLPGAGGEDCRQRDDVLENWLRQASTNRAQLAELLSHVHGYRIPTPRGSHETLVEYDRRRAIKEMLTEQTIAACVEAEDTGRMIRAAITRGKAPRVTPQGGPGDWEEPAVRVLRGVLECDVAAVDDAWEEMIEGLLQQPLLYVALARGGNPPRIVTSRAIQHTLGRLLTYLPRLGLLEKTTWLIETIQDMELNHPVGAGAITEFDHMFEIGCKGIVRCLVESSTQWHPGRRQEPSSEADRDLIEFLETATETLLRCWLIHSRGVRLSVLEAVSDQPHREELEAFIRQYGGDLFTQRFMILGNIRAILHEGVETWLQSLWEEPHPEEDFQLLHDLAGQPSRGDAIRHLTLILEAVVDNYAEYIDYNSTTTQSDRGEMLYTLLDFLRLQCDYDRVAWNLQPVMLAHEVLVRCGRDEVAESWRSAVAQRTADIADGYLERLAELSRKYSMRLPSITGRIEERFVRPLAVDRLRSLVRPAVDDVHAGRPSEAFRCLEEEAARFTGEPAGAGFDVPQWLEALEFEVERVLYAKTEDEQDWLDPYLPVLQVRLSREEALQQMQAMESESRDRQAED